MNHAEISRRLAIAIGYSEKDVYVSQGFSEPYVCAVHHKTGPYNTGPHRYLFDYRDPSVMWPIAERFDCFPVFHTSSQTWSVSLGQLLAHEYAETASLAVARAVIKSKESEK